MANEITYNTEVLKSIRSNYKDAYILVKGTSTIKDQLPDISKIYLCQRSIQNKASIAY